MTAPAVGKRSDPVPRIDLTPVLDGEPCSPGAGEVQAQMREVFPNARASLGLGYGMTEATGMATINFGAELEAHPESVGRALPTIGVAIRDADGQPVPEGAETTKGMPRRPLTRPRLPRARAAQRSSRG